MVRSWDRPPAPREPGVEGDPERPGRADPGPLASRISLSWTGLHPRRSFPFHREAADGPILRIGPGFSLRPRSESLGSGSSSAHADERGTESYNPEVQGL